MGRSRPGDSWQEVQQQHQEEEEEEEEEEEVPFFDCW
jgi:hypothetical protein